MRNHTILTLLKFGEENNIMDLYENGTIYLNTIDHFRKLENDELRGDKYEGVSQIRNSFPGSFFIPSINRAVKYQRIHLLKSHEITLGNLYCLYGVSSKGFPNPLDFEIDTRNSQFGSQCLLIKNNPYFLNRIITTLKTKGYNVFTGFVEYYNKDQINRSVTLFEKPIEFEYQKEFRIYVENDRNEPIVINIGNLKDYSQIIKMEDILKLKLKVTRKTNNN